MPYPEYICTPMRQELTNVGFQELRTPADVDQNIPDSTGTVLLVLNSVCGCAAGT
ncbi:MAG: BrxA/BrxB family bacilliredoxin, partial [Flavobacteriales bacterium]